MARVVVAAFGPYGDVHPLLGIADVLRARHQAFVVRTSVGHP